MGSFPVPATPFPGLRSLARCGGCAAKVPPEVVARLTAAAGALGAADARVRVGLTPADDAAVYALDDERALVATVDFFPPVVDDPADYGTVAAANAISDVYAMGGSVAFALALSGFPDVVPREVVLAVNRAAAAVVTAAGGAVLGGHSIRCDEPVFGLCVLGFVHPARIWRKSGARPGQAIVLSKPLGTGLLLSGRTREGERTAVESMRRTNAAAAAALHALPRPPGAVTDVSGYGLLGHAHEVATQSQVRLRIAAADVPVLAGAREAAAAGVRTSAHRERARAAGPGAARRVVLEDPQTSGGLLATVEPDDAPALAAAGFVRIGTVESGGPAVLVDD
jgi:selenide,water dikinase